MTVKGVILYVVLPHIQVNTVCTYVCTFHRQVFIVQGLIVQTAVSSHTQPHTTRDCSTLLVPWKQPAVDH